MHAFFGDVDCFTVVAVDAPTVEIVAHQPSIELRLLHSSPAPTVRAVYGCHRADGVVSEGVRSVIVSVLEVRNLADFVLPVGVTILVFSTEFSQGLIVEHYSSTEARGDGHAKDWTTFRLCGSGSAVHGLLRPLWLDEMC